MSDLNKQLFYSAENLTDAPKSIKIAIQINLIIMLWMPTLGMAISDLYLGRIPNMFVIIFTIALFVLYSKLYIASTQFGRHPILIYLSSFSTLAMFFFVSYYNDWPLDLVFAESVAVEMLAFVTALLVTYIMVIITSGKKDVASESKKKKPGLFIVLLLVLLGLSAFVAIIYFRFEGVLKYFTNELMSSTSNLIFIGIPFAVVVTKYIVILLRKSGNIERGSNEINIISLNYGVPMLLNLLVPGIMYVVLYYEPPL